ncbi:4Fe-4S dicluster domain-containing protein [Chloroflexota bacterium]
MPKYGLLIEYEYCVGCHACEFACKQEHNCLDGESGICVNKVESEIAGGKLYYFPFPTDNCNLCGKRIARGLKPACVHSCWVGAMKFGTIQELAMDIQKKPKKVLWAPY